jgi:hypothetical protein
MERWSQKSLLDGHFFGGSSAPQVSNDEHDRRLLDEFVTRVMRRQDKEIDRFHLYTDRRVLEITMEVGRRLVRDGTQRGGGIFVREWGTVAAPRKRQRAGDTVVRSNCCPSLGVKDYFWFEVAFAILGVQQHCGDAVSQFGSAGDDECGKDCRRR